MNFLPSSRVVAALLVAASISCKSAPPPPPDGDTTAAQPQGDTTRPSPDSVPVSDTVPAPPAAGDSGRRTPTLDDLRAEVMRMIATAAAANADLCRTIAFGAKPCGGPQQYLIYSASTTDSTALAAAVARYNALESETNTREGRVSDCMLVAPPRLALIDGRCTAAPAGPGGK